MLGQLPNIPHKIIYHFTNKIKVFSIAIFLQMLQRISRLVTENSLGFQVFNCPDKIAVRAYYLLFTNLKTHCVCLKMYKFHEPYTTVQCSAGWQKFSASFRTCFFLFKIPASCVVFQILQQKKA